MRMNRFEDAVAEAVEEDDGGRRGSRRSSTCASPPTTRRSSSSCTRSSPQAAERGASDIHFEPQPDATGRGPRDARPDARRRRARPRPRRCPKRMVPGVVSRIKIMADLDIAERRHPAGRPRRPDDRGPPRRRPRGHDPQRPRRGRRACASSTRRASASSSTSSACRSRSSTRFRRAFTPGLRRGARRPARPARASRPSLYGALSELNTPEKNIITIEDPVEYQIGGITQVQVNTKAGLTFAAGLRSMMRADPDILMVGEIRDRETAQIADRGRAHRPHGPLHAAHQRRAVGDHPPDRDGDRAVPGRLGDRLRGRPAARAHAVRALQAAHDHPGRGAPRPRLPGRVRPSRPTSRAAACAAAAWATAAGSASTR